MRRRSWAVAALLIGVLGGTAGCSAVPDADAVPSPSASTPSATPTPVAEREPARMPGSCFQLIGQNLHLLMEARELTLRSTDDTIQGRFSGIGYRGTGVPRSLSCAYASEYGGEQADGDAQDNGRYEFGVEMLTAPEREVLLGSLRDGPGENTTGLTEQTVGDALLFTQEGAPASDTVPDDWAIVFTVFPDAWTMVWSPDGGPEVLDQHLEWAEQLEESLYPSS